MKQVWTQNNKNNKQGDREERDHHYAKKVKTHVRQKANNAIDRALKRKDLRYIYDLDDLQ